MAKLVLLNKPYDVLCQFTDTQNRATLADFIQDPSLTKVYPAGRLDRDSEGLVLLTDDGALQHQIAHPKVGKIKTYWVQVEGAISDDAILQLAKGVKFKDGVTQQADVKRIEDPTLWPRTKPVRFRAQIPTSWISMGLREGKNRQVRRMTAAVGFPTLRLVRISIDRWSLKQADTFIQPGEFKVVDVPSPKPDSTKTNANNMFKKVDKGHTKRRNQRRKKGSHT